MESIGAVQSGGMEESALRDFLRMLRRRLPIVVLVVALFAGGALAFSLWTEKKYTATAKLLFRDPGFDQKLFGGSGALAPSQDPAREAATNVGLVGLDTIAARASNVLGNARLTPPEILDKVDVIAQGQSNVVIVMATDESRAFAAELANTIAKQYIDFRREADRSKITEALISTRKQLRALGRRERNGQEGKSIKQQRGQLRILASLQTGNAELVQPAEPPRRASSPKPARNTVFGLVAGLVLGVALAMLRDRLDRRLRNRTDAETILGRPVLGVIPESRALRADEGEALHLVGQEGEAFRMLRTNLRYFDIDQEIHSLLITSSAPGDGKSTVARYLAATAAASNVRVVLLEADLRRPTLDSVAPDLHGRGLTNVLAGQASLDQVIQQLPLDVSGRPDSGRTLDAVASGPVPPNPSDLLESDRMREVLTNLEERYELVVVDSSPVTVVPDSIPLMGCVSGTVIVVREKKSTKTGLGNLRKQLENLNVSALGIVINGAAAEEEGAYYGYYGYGTPDAGPDAGDSGGGGSANGARPSRWPRRPRRRRTDAQQESAA